MNEAQIKVAVSDDGQQAVVTATEDGKTVLSFSVDATGLEDMIRGLAQVRATMADQVPLRLELPARVEVVSDPAWWSEPKPEHTFVGFRHPGFGWLGFLLPPAEAKGLAGWLLKGVPSEG